MSDCLLNSDDLRARFATRLQAMYREEVPAYAQLHDLTLELNRSLLSERGDARADEPASVAALSAPRHGAIRVGSAAELAWLTRLFALLGMQPVDFYDLVPAGLPVMSSAFRPLSVHSLARNPLRMFCSLLRPELIADASVRELATAAIATRDIFSSALKAMIEGAEASDGVAIDQEEAFLSEALNVFRWQGWACVDQACYDTLASEHRLIADIAAFPGPHINHLTPSILDIDRLQAAMIERGFNAKAIVEGPPRRSVAILLRQTACTAVAEDVVYPSAGSGATRGGHTARFGEVEQRGVALTAKGRALYDACLEGARSGSGGKPYAQALVEAFADFPDDIATLIEADLAYFEYTVDPAAPAVDLSTPEARAQAVRAGVVEAQPIRYEDFLPVSAAGIFRSNLGDGEDESYNERSSQDAFEAALGRPVQSSQAIYAAQQDASINLFSRERAA